MFSWILTVKTDEEWMLTLTRTATLTLEELEFRHILPALNTQTYSTRVPAELAYIAVIGDMSKLELEESDKSGSVLIDLPIRGCLAAKTASRESWRAWNNQPGFTWTMVTG